LSKKIIKLPKRNRVDKNKKISINFNRNYNQRVDFKPSGLWYACNNEWLKFTQDWISEKHHKYIHKLNIKRNVLTNIREKNKKKILVIKNLKDLDLFFNKYSFKVDWFNKWPKLKSLEKQNYLIDWEKVSQDFGGIEICPYLGKKRLPRYFWYSTWDVASGCIWNLKDILKDTQLIYQGINNKYIKVSK
tara:strand:- start:635 stop:1201 length:567 start_codon:yes stop_codon:yes gene_type:complete